jgi:hypothetical protein
MEVPPPAIIDSSALLDDRGRVYVPSGDAHLYALDRESGRELWRFRAHTPEQVEALHDIELFNVDWWEGNVAMLADGTLLAGNDNYLYYRIDRDTGAERGHWLGNELGWSLPAVNTRTGRVFFGSMFIALRNLFAFDAESGEKIWSSGGLGSIVSSPLLTSTSADGAVVVGGFDGYVRAFGQKSGRQIWRFATRDHVYASPAQLADGRIVAASTDGTVYALDPERGERVWAFDTLAPIRSSPAVDAEDHIYFGSGDGRLFASIDGRLRWSYRCIEDDRDDLNGSPRSARTDPHRRRGRLDLLRPLRLLSSDAGKADRRCASGAAKLPDDGARLYFTSRFGGLSLRPPAEIDANEPLAFTLSVRAHGDTELAAIDKDDLAVESSSGRALVEVSADRRFVTIVPETAWAGREGGTLRVELRGAFRTEPWRLGLKAFGGSASGRFAERFEFAVRRARRPRCLHRSATARRSRDRLRDRPLAAPNPTMLPSWNQIGFDSIRWLGGVVEGGDRAVLWFGRPTRRRDGASSRGSRQRTRFALVLDWDDGPSRCTTRAPSRSTSTARGACRTGAIGSRRAEPDGRIAQRPALNAVADCDEIANYGPFLKGMGMSEWDTGLMHIYGGADLSLWDGGTRVSPEDVGEVDVEIGATEAIARIRGGRIRRSEHAVGLLLVDAQSGLPVSLSYAFVTAVETDASGVVTAVRIHYDSGTLPGPVRAHYMIDTVPAFTAR